MTMTSDLADFVLLDSNILIYAEQEEAPQHEVAKSLRDRALRGDIPACVSPQVLTEFFSVVTNTRRQRVSDPLTVQEAIDQVRKYNESENLTVIYPGAGIVERVLSLLEAHPVSGRDIHDLHLIATMLSNGVTKIYTFNTKDFTPFSEIQVFAPSQPQPSA